MTYIVRRDGVNMDDPLTICASVCTSGCHADDCDHHGHLPASPTRDALDVEALAAWLVERGVTFHMADGSAHSASMLDCLREYAAILASRRHE